MGWFHVLQFKSTFQNLEIEKKMHSFPSKRLHLPDFTCHDILMMMMMMINKSAVTHQLTPKDYGDEWKECHYCPVCSVSTAVHYKGKHADISLFCFIPSWLPAHKADVSPRAPRRPTFCVNKVTCVTCRLPAPKYHMVAYIRPGSSCR